MQSELSFLIIHECVKAKQYFHLFVCLFSGITLICYIYMETLMAKELPYLTK